MSNVNKHRKYLVLMGVAIMNMTVSTTIYLGNLTTYIISIQEIEKHKAASSAVATVDEVHCGDATTAAFDSLASVTSVTVTSVTSHHEDIGDENSSSSSSSSDGGGGGVNGDGNGGNDTTRCYDAVVDDRFDIDQSWLVSVYMICKLMATVFADYSAKKFGLGLTNLLGILLSIIGPLLSYFTVSHSIWLVTVTFSGIGGVGNNIIFACNLIYVAGWFDKRVATASSVNFGSATFGGAILNQVITAFVNPKNLGPDASAKGMAFFSQPEIIDRIPKVFLLLAAMNAFLQIAGFLLLKNPEKNKTRTLRTSPYNAREEEEVGGRGVEEKEGNEFENESVGLLTEKREQVFTNESAHTIEAEFYSSQTSRSSRRNAALGASGGLVRKSVETIRPTGNENSRNHSQSHANRSDLNLSSDGHLSHSVGYQSSALEIDDKNNDDNEDGKTSMTPLEMLKTTEFYLLSVVFLALAVGLTLTANYYKVFGLLWITDDQFLATIGSTMAVVMTISMFLCGPMMERFGAKNVLIGNLTVCSITMSLWYFVAQVNKWLYMFWVICISCVAYNAQVLQSLTALKFFGKRYFAMNYGVIQTASILVFLMGPLVYSEILSSLGWFWLFFMGGSLSFCALLTIVCKMAPSS